MYYYKQEIDGNTFYFSTEEAVSYDGATQVTKEVYDAYMEEQRKIAEALKNKRYYYKKGNSYLNLKSPITEDGYIEITKKEYELATINTVEIAYSKEQQYPKLVEKYIREKYSLSDELAILRQRDTKPEEFTNYYNYAEECKAKAKQDLNITE